MEDSKQQGIDAVLAIAKDVEERVQELGERVDALFAAAAVARGSSIRLSYALSRHMATKIGRLDTTSRWSEPLPHIEWLFGRSTLVALPAATGGTLRVADQGGGLPMRRSPLQG